MVINVQLLSPLNLLNIFNSRDKVRVISHLFLQTLEEGEVCGVSWPETFLILKDHHQHVVRVQSFIINGSTLSEYSPGLI